jgi:tetrahydromethanopterin S-methyltransferase subunit A
MDELARLLSTSKETSMTVSKEFINDKLNEAQQLLWGGSETENIAAHNIIAELIKDLQDEQ